MPWSVTGNLIIEGVVTIKWRLVMEAMKRFVDRLHLNTKNLFLSPVFDSRRSVLELVSDHS